MEQRPSAKRRVGASLLRIAATALAGGLLCATLVRLSPGFGLDERQLDPTLSRQTQEAIRRSRTLGSSTAGFYAGYLEQMAKGDFGISMALGRPIRELLAERAPVTVQLMLWGIAGAWTLAGFLAIPASARRSARLAAICNVMSGIPASLPAAGMAICFFWIGGAARWTIALVLFPKIYLYLEGLLRQTYGLPHVLLARAKGLGAARIFFRHVLLPARAQLLALAALSVNMAFGAAVAVEAITDLPGLGQLAWKAATARDLPVLVILTLLIALVTQTANLVADICGPTTGKTA